MVTSQGKHANRYADAFKAMIAGENGHALASYISIHGQGIHKYTRQISKPSPKTLDTTRQRLPDPWSIVAATNLESISHLPEFLQTAENHHDDYHEAFKCQLALINALLRIASNVREGASNGWVLPILYAASRNLVCLAELADRQLRQIQEKIYCLEECSRVLTRCFTSCLQDRSLPLSPHVHLRYDTSKRKGVYYFANTLFKVYFKLKNTSLCKNIIRSVSNAKNLKPLDEYPIADQVTHRYFLGTLAFLDENYEQAEEHLEFAFRNCDSSATKNIEMILLYLIPLRLQKGCLPSRLLLDYIPPLKRLYEPFIEAFRSSDLASFDHALEKHVGLAASTGKAQEQQQEDGQNKEEEQPQQTTQELKNSENENNDTNEPGLLEKGTYLIMLRAREGCVRGLCKQVWLIREKCARIELKDFKTAFKFSGLDIDSDEVECIIANLIFKGHLKGYISHERQMLVLSKTNPFPPLYTQPITSSAL